MLETFGMYMTYRKIGTAKPNIYKQSIPGMNGSLDYTSFYGETTFENREIELKFAKKVDADTQNLKDQIEKTFNGKEVKVAVVPPDKGGYAVLDIVFGNEMSAELVVNPFEIKDDATGKVITGNTYLARTVDENGEIYECRIKPSKNSDKALLNMILR